MGWEEILINKIHNAREEDRKHDSKTSQPVMTLISVPLGGDLIHAFAMTVVLAFYSLYFGQILTPAILFTILILVDVQTNAINVSILSFSRSGIQTSSYALYTN